MQKFLNSKSIAIIGASETEGKIGRILLENLAVNKNLEIFLVNPGHEEIMGKKCYASVLDIEKDVDLAVIAIPVAMVIKAVEECAQKKVPIKNIIVISAGFSEAGEAGKESEKKLKELAEKYELNILGPNCLGTINVQQNINVSFAKKETKKGEVGLVMQSGAFTTALLDIAEKENFGFSSIVTLGNKTCLDEVDFMDYFEKDTKTKIVIFYLENISRGEKFRKKLKTLAKEKKVIVLKAGNSEKVKAAIQSHTGAMAGEIEIIKEVIKEAGAYYVNNIFDLINLLKIFSGFKLPQNNKLVIITNAGGPGVIATDLIESVKNLQLVEFSLEEKKQIKKGLPSAASVENPIDILGDATSERYEMTLKNISQFKNIGSIIALITPQAQTDVQNIIQKIIEANKKLDFPVYPIIIAGPAKDEADKILKENNFSGFNYSREIVAALDELFNNRKSNYTESKKIDKNKERIKITEELLKSKRGVLFTEAANQLGKVYGFNILESRTINSQEEIRENNWSFPVVLKIDSQKIIHKKAQGGVVLNVQNIQELESHYQRIKDKLGVSRFTIQSQVNYNLEIILGIKNDPAFGKVLMVGLGGIFTEFLNEKKIILLPTDRENIAKKLENSVLDKVLKKEGLKLDILVKEIKKLSVLAEEVEDIKEMDINPLVFCGQKPIVLDIKVILK